MEYFNIFDKIILYITLFNSPVADTAITPVPCRLAPGICAQPVTGRVLRSVPGRSSGLRCAPLRTSLLVVIWVAWSNRCPPGKLLNAAAALSPSGSWLCTREPLQPLATSPLSRSRHWHGYPPARPGWLRHHGRVLTRAFHSVAGRSSALRSPDQLLAIVGLICST